MGVVSLLYKREIPINEHIKVIIPTVGEIMDDETTYYSILNVLTGMPIDFMVELDDAGIDFTEIDEYELFLMMWGGIQAQDTSLIFGDLDTKKFELCMNQENNTIILYDRENDITIDRAIHGLVADALRKIHHLKRDVRKPGNKEAREYMIERARKKKQRLARKPQESQLETFIVALVNTEQYKYDFESTRNLSIYQFNECLAQIIKKVDYDNRMIGIYTGNISAKDMRQDDLNWLVHDKK